ncbi:hypothetical protein SEA_SCOOBYDOOBYDOO_173 [Mycobacterium phage ScoobyDoobyDoo]|nr:hypothetical protein SEA_SCOOBYDOOBYDOO_173 [Mycobacterium phage ScoobyDoobyDoo]
MRVQDELRWADHELEMQADETSRKFHEFFKAWFGLAHTMVDGVETQWPVMDAVRSALRTTEDDLGFLSMEWIGQMLLVASQHWVHGDRMVEGMTALESRMMEQMAAIKLVELQESADA